ncbi:hypothetical protein FRB93_002503 [Tulasnella sp. JGI-2019a]|nr:hypothetical protein FRB93_002503 [Tulasnella sp. JGI-2019a]
MASALRTVWRTVTGRRGLVGKDLKGNKYYEFPNAMSDVLRARRTVKYKNPEDMYPGTSALPVQWNSWLSHTRADPPSLQELQADGARMIQLKANILVIQERDREERARLAAAAASTEQPHQVDAPLQGQQSDRAELGETKSRTELADPQILKRPPQPFAPTHASSSGREEQPEPWIPHSSIQRGR